MPNSLLDVMIPGEGGRTVKRLGDVLVDHNANIDRLRVALVLIADMVASHPELLDEFESRLKAVARDA